MWEYILAGLTAGLLIAVPLAWLLLRRYLTAKVDASVQKEVERFKHELALSHSAATALHQRTLREHELYVARKHEVSGQVYARLVAANRASLLLTTYAREYMGPHEETIFRTVASTLTPKQAKLLEEERADLGRRGAMGARSRAIAEEIAREAWDDAITLLSQNELYLSPAVALLCYALLYTASVRSDFIQKIEGRDPKDGREHIAASSQMLSQIRDLMRRDLRGDPAEGANTYSSALTSVPEGVRSAVLAALGTP